MKGTHLQSYHCVKHPGLCDRANCCMDGKRPGYDATVEPVMVKLSDVIDTITNVRSTVPAYAKGGAAVMQGDIIRHLYEKFGVPKGDPDIARLRKGDYR